MEKDYWQRYKLSEISELSILVEDICNSNSRAVYENGSDEDFYSFIEKCVNDGLLNYDFEILKQAVTYLLDNININKYKNILQGVLKQLDLSKERDMDFLKYIHDGYSYPYKQPQSSIREEILTRTNAVAEIFINDKVREKGLTDRLIEMFKKANFGSLDNSLSVIKDTKILDSEYCLELMGMIIEATLPSLYHTEKTSDDLKDYFFSECYSKYIANIIKHCDKNDGINERTVELSRIIKNCPSSGAAEYASYLATDNEFMNNPLALKIINKVCEMTLGNSPECKIIYKHTIDFVEKMVKITSDMNEEQKQEQLNKIYEAIDLFDNMSFEDLWDLFSEERYTRLDKRMDRICGILLDFKNQDYYDLINIFKEHYTKEQKKGIARTRTPNNDK